MKEELGFGDDKVESKKNWRNLDGVCVDWSSYSEMELEFMKNAKKR
jgi:hypothetical protein